MHKSLFGVVIRKIRLERGLTQEKLASLSGLERTFISMLERGIKQPSLKTISNLAKAFKLKNSELLHLVEHEIHAASDVAGVDPDLDEDQRCLDALEKEREKLRIGEIVDSIPVVFFARTTMPEYAVTFISKNVKQLLGYDRERFMEPGRFWDEHIHKEDLPKVLNILRGMNANQVLNHEYRFLASSGQWLKLREELKLVVNESGIHKEVIGSIMGGVCED